MAAGAELRRLEAEGGRAWVLDIVHAVAVDAGGDVRVAFLQQRRAVNAGQVLLVDGVVAAGAGLRDPGARAGEQRPALWIGQPAGVVGAMTIGAYRGGTHASRPGLLVCAVQRALVFTGVTALAGGVELQAQIAPIGGLEGWVGILAQAGMALGAGIASLAVHRLREDFGIDVERELLAVLQRHGQVGVAVASQAALVADSRLLRLGGGAERDHRQPQGSKHQGGQPNRRALHSACVSVSVSAISRSYSRG